MILQIDRADCADCADLADLVAVLPDRTPDTNFYASPRFVTHIDDYAIKALTKYYESVFPPSNTPGVAILDLCSSWVSRCKFLQNIVAYTAAQEVACFWQRFERSA
jgi:hypothetical protein